MMLGKVLYSLFHAAYVFVVPGNGIYPVPGVQLEKGLPDVLPDNRGDIFIHHIHMFAGAVPGKRCLDGFLAIVFCTLLNLHDGVQPRTTARVDIHIQAPHHLIHLFIYNRLARHPHQELVLEGTRE